ncbi:MAG: DinB family protein [Spirochaetota bacterium]
MDTTIETLLRMTKTEWDGKSLMGKPLLPTLRDLPLDTVRNVATYEGYSAWGIALHVLYHKWAMLAVMGGAPRPELYPYEQADWPKPPATQDEASWKELLALLEKVHAAYVATLAAMSPAKLGDEIAAWKCSVCDALETMSHHDLYHVVQIRNMGLKNLPKA